MSSYVAWNDIRPEYVRRAGGEAAVQAGKNELLAEIVHHQHPGVDDHMPQRHLTFAATVHAGPDLATTSPEVLNRVPSSRSVQPTTP